MIMSPQLPSLAVLAARHIIAHSMRHEKYILISGLPSGWQRAETLVGVPYYIK
jgi:hypothetical protein